MPTNAPKVGCDGPVDICKEKLVEALTKETVLSKISHRIQYFQRIHIPVVASMGAESGPEKDLTMDGIIRFMDSPEGRILEECGAGVATQV